MKTSRSCASWSRKNASYDACELGHKTTFVVTHPFSVYRGHEYAIEKVVHRFQHDYLHFIDDHGELKSIRDSWTDYHDDVVSTGNKAASNTKCLFGYDNLKALNDDLKHLLK